MSGNSMSKGSAHMAESSPNGQPLADHHQSMLRASSISGDVIRRRRYRSITDASDLAGHGFKQHQERPGLLIPIWWGGEVVQHQLRPDEPRADDTGKLIKYETPGGSSVRLDCHPTMQPGLDDPFSRKWVTEGIKKVDALTSLGEVAIGLTGVWNWLSNGEPLNDWDDVALDGSEVYIAYDSDVMTKPEVEEAARRLTSFLRRRGASVRWVYLPEGLMGDKVGVDDYLAEGHDLDDLLDLATDPPRDVPEDWPVPDEYRVPKPWVVTDMGVAKLAKVRGEEAPLPVPVAHAPFLISGRLLSEDGREAVELSWLRDGRWLDGTYDRDVIADRNKLLKLAADGLPVHSGNNTDLTRYLADLEAANLHAIPTTRMTDQLGWVGDDFVTRERSDIVFHGPGGLRQVVASYRESGTLDGWQDAVEVLADHPRAALSIYASLGPVLLPIIDGPPFVLDWSGQTSTGKTTTLRVAASVWGAPDLMRSWEATTVAIENLAGMLNGLPLLLDDTRRARDDDAIIKVIYDVAAGEGRARGAKLGGLQATKRWSTIVLSTGEQPITTYGQDAGARGRVVSVWGSPFEAEDRDLVDGLTRAVAENYGHAGPAFVRAVLAHREEWGAWRDRYEQVVADLAGDATSVIEQRRARHVAVLRMAAGIAEAYDVVGWTAPETLWQSLLVSGAGREDDDRPAAALHVAWDWAVGHAHHFLGMRPSMHGEPSRGWAGRWDRPDDNVAYLGRVLRSVLEGQGFEYEATLAAWGERGWIDTGNDKGNTKVVKLGDSRVRMVVIRYSAIRDVVGETSHDEDRVLQMVEGGLEDAEGVG